MTIVRQIVFHVKHLGALIVTLAGVVMLTGVVSLGLLALVPGCSQVCVDAEVGEWAFVDGRWIHCESWVAACDSERSRLVGGVGDAAVGGVACAAKARSFGCKP